MTRCAICGAVLNDGDPIREAFTGSGLEVCRECDNKLAAVKCAAEDADAERFSAACEALMTDERKGRSEAANQLLDTYCKKCKNPEYAEEDEPNSFIQQIQESMIEEELENLIIEKEIKSSRIALVTRICGVIIFIAGVALSVLMGFEYRHISIDYMSGGGITATYNYAIAVFGSLAFLICSLLIIVAGEHFHHQHLRTQMLEKLYDKAYDKLNE